MKSKFYLLTIHIETNSGEFFTGERYSYLDCEIAFEYAVEKAFETINKVFKEETQTMAEMIRLKTFKSVVFTLFNPNDEIINEIKFVSNAEK